MVDYTPTLIPLPATAQSPYLSPDAVKAQRDYAKALLTGSGQQPVQHWTQGVSNMVSALMGGLMQKGINDRENASNDITGSRMAVPLSPPAGGGRSSFSEAPSGEGDTNTADGGDSSPRNSVSSGEMAARKAATASIESGSPEGNYGAIGPIVKTGAYAGDRAYGKYQVMGKNLTNWSKEIFGRVMTPEEFMKNPQAQETMFETKSTRDPRDWFGHGKSDGYTTGTAYEKKYAEGLKKYGGGGAEPAMAFSGAPAEAAGPAAISAAALRGKPLLGPERPSPVAGEKPLIDPALVPRVPQISEERMRAIMSDPRIPWEQKTQMQGMYLQQQQIIEVPYPGGKVRIDPRDPTRQQFIPDLHWGRKKFPSGMEYDLPSTVNPGPGGGSIQTPATQAPPLPIGPRSDAGSPATPSAAPQGGPAAAPAPVLAAAPDVPVPAPRPAGAGPSASDLAAAPAPVQVASLDPTAGVAKAGEPPMTPTEKQMMAMVNPDAAAPLAGAIAGAPKDAGPAAAPPAAPTPVSDDMKVAQASPPHSLSPLAGDSKPPPGYTAEDWESERRYKQFQDDAAIKLKERESLIQADTKNEEKQIENGWKDYENQREFSRGARELLPNVETALNLLNDKRIHTGMLAGAQDAWSRFKEAFGEKAANAPNELFDKSAAAAVLLALKPTLQGTGQVRLMEVQLLQKANASRYYGDAANRAVLEISRRALTKMGSVGKMADQYVLGQDVTDPDGHVLLKAGEGKRRGLDAGFNQIASSWIEGQNKKDLEYYKNTDRLFTTGMSADGEKLYKMGEGDKMPSNPEVGQPWTFHDKKGKDVQAVFDGKSWVPREKYTPVGK